MDEYNRVIWYNAKSYVAKRVGCQELSLCYIPSPNKKFTQSQKPNLYPNSWETQIHMSHESFE